MDVIGDIDGITYRENILYGGFYITPNITYKGNKVPSGDSNSFIWFRNSTRGTGDTNFNVNENACVSLSRNKETGDDGNETDIYSAIYSDFNNISIGENANFNFRVIKSHFPI